MQRVDGQTVYKAQTLPSLGLGPLVGDTGPGPNAVQGSFQAAAQNVILGREGKAQNTAPFIPQPAESQTQYNFPVSPFSGPGSGTGRGGAEADGSCVPLLPIDLILSGRLLTGNVAEARDRLTRGQRRMGWPGPERLAGGGL